MALQRRTLLQVATAVGVLLAGCTGGDGTDGTGTETPTDSDRVGPEPHDIHVVFHNHLSHAVTVAVELSTEGTVLLDDEVTIEANGFASLDTGIDETGQYDLAVAVDDRETELSFEMDEYDLEMGSNVIFWIDEDEIRHGIEE